VTTCPSCGRPKPEDRDFCECGEYLRWDPTSYRPVVQRSPRPEDESAPATPEPPPVAPVRSAPAQPEPVARQPSVVAELMLRLPNGETTSPGPVTVTAEAGGRTSVLGLLRNESTIVDNYDLTIRGLPDGWWSISPPVAYLVPYGASGAYEQELEADLHPPRTPDAFARPWAFEVVATSRAYATTAASALATLIVTPYVDISSEVRPERATGRWRARYVLSVRNTSNAATQVMVHGEDTDGSCRFRFPQQALTVRPGEQSTMQFSVRPPRQIWVGKPVERHLSVFASPAGVDERQAPSRVTFRQRSWLPKWLVILLIALLLLGGGAVAAKLISDSAGHSSSSTSTAVTP
jgi:hypothetical protein